jgi:hypothetical protein
VDKWIKLSTYVECIIKLVDPYWLNKESILYTKARQTGENGALKKARMIKFTSINSALILPPTCKTRNPGVFYELF